LFRIWRALKLHPKEIKLKRSNSKGWHLIVWKEMFLGNKIIAINEYRKYLGDDKLRIKLDKKRKQPRQYLFYKKVKK